MRLLHVGAGLDDESRIGDAAGVEVELALSRPLGDAGPLEVLVELARRVAWHIEEGLTMGLYPRDGEQTLKQGLGKRLENPPCGSWSKRRQT